MCPVEDFNCGTRRENGASIGFGRKETVDRVLIPPLHQMAFGRAA